MTIRERIINKISNLSSAYKKWYEMFFILLAIIVVIMLALDFNNSLTVSQQQRSNLIDLIILIIFTLDYLFRLYLVEHKLRFIKENVFDLLAIIPFDLAFRAFRLARLFRIVRVISITKRVWSPLFELLRTNGLHYILLFTTFLILIGSMSIMIFEESINNFGDALWWSIVTTTTVGYGDISPVTTGGRIVATVLMFIGIGSIGMLTGSIATFFINKTINTDEESLKDEFIELIKEKLDNIDQLTENETEILKNITISVLDNHIKNKKNDS